MAGDSTAGQAFATGHAVAVAQRLESAARGGEILIGETTRRLVENAALVEADLAPEAEREGGRRRGLAADRRARGRAVVRPPARRRRWSAGDGSSRELRGAFDDAVEEQACRMITVLGPAGIGKSRLANELLGSVREEASVLVGRCLPYGEGITYWPLRDVVREAAGDLTLEQIEGLLEGEEDAGRVAACVAGAVGVGETAGAADETLWAVRRLFEHMSRDRPLVVGFDDLHWAEPTFLDLIEYLAGWSRDAPILLVCLARPELLDKHPTWLTVTPNATSITLEALSEQEAESLLDVLRGEAELSSDILASDHRGGRGQPALRRADARDDDRRTTRRPARCPPSIHALLAARLDRLEPEERATIERASVIGRDFWRGAVADLSREEDRPLVSPLLMTLVRKDLIEPARSIFPWEDGFRFRHVAHPRRRVSGDPEGDPRRTCTSVFAAWLERTAGERANEFEEILGYHLEQAFRYREELGPVGPRRP